MRKLAFPVFLVMFAALMALAIATIQHRRGGNQFQEPPADIYNEP